MAFGIKPALDGRSHAVAGSEPGVSCSCVLCVPCMHYCVRTVFVNAHKVGSVWLVGLYNQELMSIAEQFMHS